MNEDLKKIKKYYGESMMQLCRSLFPTLLEEEGKLSSLIMGNFYSSGFLFEDLDIYGKTGEFKNYIYSLANIDQKTLVVEPSIDTPQKLLASVGYDLFECKNEEEIQLFKKYYAKDEELCTFKNERLNSCFVFFAVKKNVNQIIRSQFEKPERQDEYGTSVISIQFTRDDSHTLSIKNRYNHVVSHPDATFSNNLDNIVIGLTDSFEEHYQLKQEHVNKFEIPGYVMANDGKYYKYNYEINNIYYCPNNVIIDNLKAKQLEKEKYVVLDYFILDLQNGAIKLYDDMINDSFTDSISNFDKIEVVNGDYAKEILIYNSDKVVISKIKLDKSNRIVGIVDKANKSIGRRYLSYNTTISNIEFPLLEEIGDEFLSSNNGITSLNLPKIEKIGDCFLLYNKVLSEVNLPKLKKVGTRFLRRNEEVKKLYLPELETAGRDFLYCNKVLISVDIPMLKVVGDSFLYDNKDLCKISLLNLSKVGDGFLYYNKIIASVDLPMLQEAGRDFMCYNKTLEYIGMPSLIKVGENFLYYNRSLKKADFVNLTEKGTGFLQFVRERESVLNDNDLNGKKY